jgi:hypothetical protein
MKTILIANCVAVLAMTVAAAGKHGPQPNISLFWIQTPLSRKMLGPPLAQSQSSNAFSGFPLFSELLNPN